MNGKSFFLRLIPFFSAASCFSLHAKTATKGMTTQMAMTGMISSVSSLIIVSFLFYVVMNLVQDRWGALQASLTLVGSYILGGLLMFSLFHPFHFVYSSPSHLFFLTNFFLLVFPLLLQAGLWFLLFKKHGWATVLLLCGISLLFPIVMTTITALLTSLFGLIF